MDKTSFITVTPAGVESNKVTFQDAFELLFSALRQFALTVTQAHPETTPEVYDWINQGAAGILHELDPDADPNPELDINEVIAKQDLYIQTQLNDIRLNNPKRYKRLKKEFDRKKSDQRAKILEFKQNQTQKQTTKLGDAPDA